MMVIVNQYRKIEISTSFAAWAYKVLDNRVLAYIQRKKRETGRTESLDETDGSLAAVGNDIDPTIKEQLMRCLKKIGAVNKRYMRIINLHQLGYRTDEVCDRMNLKSGTFYSILSRARVMLEKCLDTGDVR